MNRVEKIEPNASGNDVQSTTRMKISQTWLASQTGPIAQSIEIARAPAALAAAGDEAPEAGAEVGAAEHRVEGHADPEDAGDGFGACSCRTLERRRFAARPVRHIAVVVAAPRASVAPGRAGSPPSPTPSTV